MIDPEKALVAAGRLRTVTSAGLILLMVLACLGALRVAMSPLETGAFLASQAGFGQVALQSWQAWSLITIVAVHVALWIMLLGYARRLFSRMIDGQPAAAAECSRALSYILWGMLLWGIASQPLASIAATWGFPEGERVLSIGLGVPQITMFFAALLAGFMAHALALGAELWQDHREVI